MIFRRAADHRRTADVDILDHLLEGAAAPQRLLERIEIDDEQIDRRDIMGQHRRLMRGIFAYRQQPAVNARMQRLHAAVHHFRKAGQLRRVLDRQACLRQGSRGAAGRDEFDPARRKRRAQFDETGLIRDGNQGAANSREVASHGNSR